MQFALRRVLAGVLVWTGCGGVTPAPKPNSNPAPVVIGGNAEPLQVKVAEVEDALGAYWPFTSPPLAWLHASPRRFRATPMAPLAEEALTKIFTSSSALHELPCARAALAHIDEVLAAGLDAPEPVNGHRERWLVIVKHDGSPDLVTECSKAAGIERLEMTGAVQHLDSSTDLALDGTVVLIGSPELVHDALMKPRAPLPEVALMGNSIAAAGGAFEGITVHADASSSATDSSLHVAVRKATSPNPLFDRGKTMAQGMAQSVPTWLDLSIKTDKPDAIEVDLKFLGTPLVQREKMEKFAHEVFALVGAAFMGSAPLMNEPYDKIDDAAMQLASQWNALVDMGKKPRLVSLPAVPKSIPRGVQVKLTNNDWAYWTNNGVPRSGGLSSYQYEVIAAPDGKSAEIIARGDLNGDGKSSKYSKRITVNPSTGRIMIPGSYTEVNPGE